MRSYLLRIFTITVVLCNVIIYGQGQVADINRLRMGYGNWNIVKSLNEKQKVGNDKVDLVKELNEKFQFSEGKNVLDALENISDAMDIIKNFYWNDDNFKWNLESCVSLSKPDDASGFQNLYNFLKSTPNPKSQYQSVIEYVNNLHEGKQSEKKSPIEVANLINDKSENALYLLKFIKAERNEPLTKALEDVTAIAYLGKYYSHKILGAVELRKKEVFLTGKNKYQKYSVNEMTQAAIYWKMFREIVEKNYALPIWSGVVKLTYAQINRYVLDDIDLAKDVLF